MPQERQQHSVFLGGKVCVCCSSPMIFSPLWVKPRCPLPIFALLLSSTTYSVTRYLDRTGAHRRCRVNTVGREVQCRKRQNAISISFLFKCVFNLTWEVGFASLGLLPWLMGSWQVEHDKQEENQYLPPPTLQLHRIIKWCGLKGTLKAIQFYLHCHQQG